MAGRSPRAAQAPQAGQAAGQQPAVQDGDQQTGAGQDADAQPQADKDTDQQTAFVLARNHGMVVDGRSQFYEAGRAFDPDEHAALISALALSGASFE